MAVIPDRNPYETDADRGSHSLNPFKSPRGRFFLIGGVSLVVVWALVAALVFNSSNSTARVLLRQKTSQPGAPSTLPASRIPAGSQAVDFGLMRIGLPKDWIDNVSCGGPGGVDNPANGWCLDRPDGSFMSIQPYDVDPPSEWQALKVNNIKVLNVSAGAIDAAAQTLFIPDMKLQYTAQGQAKNVLKSLGPSALQAVLNLKNPVAAPASWKWRSFEGISVKVPSSWPTHTLDSTTESPGGCSSVIFASPSVFMGTPKALNCPHGENVEPTRPVDGVWIDSGASVTDNATAANLPFLGPKESAFYVPNSPTPAIGVRVIGAGRTLNVLIGLGTDPTVAEEVLSSLSGPK